MEQQFTLQQLNIYIRRVLALNFQNTIWIEAEIAQVKESRGHWYLELVQKQDNEIVAQSQAVLWFREYKYLLSKHGSLLESLLQEGISIKIKAKVDFHERFGIKLIIEDIDPAFTLGQLEMERRRTLETLQKARLLQRNSSLELPLVIQRVAIISSPTAAGLQDYLNHINDNVYQYDIHHQVFAAAMQGQFTSQEIQAQLALINQKMERFDVVVILRGGGAKIDLMAFDDLELCKAIAQCQLPVITGIGHDIDETVADVVAHTALKTPTAVADFILQHNAFFETTVIGLSQQIQHLCSIHIRQQELHITQLNMRIKNAFQQQQSQQAQVLQLLEQQLPMLFKQQLRIAKQHIQNIENQIHILEPSSIMARGYSISTQAGKVLHSSTEHDPGLPLKTILKDGIIETK